MPVVVPPPTASSPVALGQTRDSIAGGARTRRHRALPLLLLSAGSLVASPAVAQPADPNDAIRPPPGTPGSTAADQPLRPPSGTPGSSASQPPSDASAAAPGTRASQREKQEQDLYSIRISSRTFVRMFQRRYLIGSTDPLPEDETLVPIYEYASLRVDRLDAPWGRDALDMRLSAWGMIDTMDVSEDRRLTGDLMEASATGRFGAAYVTLGRQLAMGAPALVARFDGASLGFYDDGGFGFDAYGGLSVHPRFASRREYVLLGSASDSLLRNPDALPDTSATDGWLAGGRVSYKQKDSWEVGAAFHERHEGGALDRRWGAVDARVVPSDDVVVGGLGMVDLDGAHVVEARGYAEAMPWENLSTTLEVLHSSPALFLSRSSVLSVFSLDTVTEAGADADLRLSPRVSLGASAHVQWFANDGAGHRLGGRVRAKLTDRVVTQVRYARVGEQDLGYHAMRGSISLQIARPWMATAAIHEYLYDQPIRGVDSSTYGSATLEYGPEEQPWRVMVGGFATRTPYAELEAEGLARLSLDLDYVSGGER